MIQDPDGTWCESPIHDWFSLSYANYLVWPRSVICQMPFEWQERFIELADELVEEMRPHLEGDYAVLIREPNGRYTTDPLADYRHPLSLTEDP